MATAGRFPAFKVLRIVLLTVVLPLAIVGVVVGSVLLYALGGWGWWRWTILVLGSLIVLAGAGLAVAGLRSTISDERHEVTAVMLGSAVLMAMVLAPISATRARVTLDNAIAVECTVLALAGFAAATGDTSTPATEHDLECAGGYPTTYFSPSPQAEVGGRFELLVDPTRALGPTTAEHEEEKWWSGLVITALAAGLYMSWSGWRGARWLITTSSRTPGSPPPA
ncbi:hypothetical protein [Actinosynnema sp. NPDC023587]|uniref:hypothetical protein n=1 Tax=Actinosynnema sp. NPDC023587 TaxID=3154695 RepID=UPI0033CBAD82